MINIEIKANEQGQRLDRFLRKYFERAPLSLIYKMIRRDVRVNGKRSRGEYMLVDGDEVAIYIADEEAAKYRRILSRCGAKKRFRIVYEDGNLLIADKPCGLLTHGAGGEKKDHLANRVTDYLIASGAYDPRTEKTFTPAPANRLDRNTTGLVLFGKTAAALRELNRLIRERGYISKFYMTIAAGRIDAPLHLTGGMTKDHERNMVMVVPESRCGDGTALSMETIVTPLEVSGDYSLVRAEILTGRTHQIRAHLASAGHPVIGDVKYGSRRVNMEVRAAYGLNTQLLHAYELKFRDAGEMLGYLKGKTFRAELPERFEQIKQEIFGTKSNKSGSIKRK